MMTLLASDFFSQFSGDRKLAAYIIFLLLELFIEGAETVTQAEIDNHLQWGKELLAQGQLADALSHYHAAVEGDPKNYLTLFKRGTVYFASGRPRFAINDFTKVLELKSDFTQALIQRGIIYMKSGEYDNAARDFAQALNEDPNDMLLHQHYSRLQPAQDQWQIVQDLIAHGDNRNAINFLTQLIELSPFSSEFRKTRAECYIAENDYLLAVNDLRSYNRLSQDSTEGIYRLAVLLYKIGHVNSALKEIRECLKYDPEHKDCFPFYKKIKKVDKALANAEEYQEEKQYEECIKSAETILKHEKDVPMVIFNAKKLLCSCYSKNEDFAHAIGQCREALEIEKDASIYCDRAEAYLGSEMYDDAIHDYQSALEMDESNTRAKEGIEKAKRVQKQAERRDYYKILGVKRSASKQEIIKAYRKAAQKWHPDNFQEGDEKKIAEKKFIDIAAAKEVLTDPEKRRQFDQGEDPLDPESNRNGFGGGNPFAHFHHGSPFQFKFHFN